MPDISTLLLVCRCVGVYIKPSLYWQCGAKKKKKSENNEYEMLIVAERQSNKAKS